MLLAHLRSTGTTQLYAAACLQSMSALDGEVCDYLTGHGVAEVMAAIVQQGDGEGSVMVVKSASCKLLSPALRFACVATRLLAPRSRRAPPTRFTLHRTQSPSGNGFEQSVGVEGRKCPSALRRMRRRRYNLQRR